MDNAESRSQWAKEVGLRIPSRKKIDGQWYVLMDCRLDFGNQVDTLIKGQASVDREEGYKVRIFKYKIRERDIYAYAYFRGPKRKRR